MTAPSPLKGSHKAMFRVIDAYDHPHGGRILRLRLGAGQAPGLRELKGHYLVAALDEGDSCRLRVAGFAVSGGRPSHARLARTGRIDVHVTGDGAGPVGPGWTVAGPV